MGTRRDRLNNRRDNQWAARKVNVVNKAKERIRRDARMVVELKSGSLPYTPVIMSWLSRQLDKPATKISQEDIAPLLA